MQNRNSKFEIIYSFMLLFFVCIIIWLLCHYKGPKLAEEFFNNPIPYEEGWHTEDGSPVILDKLNQVEGTKAGEEYSIYNTVPDTVIEGDALCFRSKNIFFQVYIDGELQYEPYVPESRIYTNSMGTKWNYVMIPVADAGETIEVRVTYVYDSARACMDNIYIAQPTGVLLNTFEEKMVAFITCILLLFVGLLLIVADIPINMRSQKNHELRYLGLFSVGIAIWCTSETNLVQIYIGGSRLMQVVSCSSLMLISIPLVLYLDTAFGFRHRHMTTILCSLSALQFLICWGLHFLKIADIHETLTACHIMLGISAVILFYVIVHSSLVNTEKHSRNIYRLLRTIGLSSLSVATGVDIIRYYRGNGTDSAMFVRIGLLLFIICFGSSSLEKTINAVKLGVQTEFVAQLAYRDGLTQIGNRTAFEEHLVDLEKIKDELPAVGIIMFDVNDLKYVNDHMGHHQGDAMLVKSAEIIQTAFADAGNDCFRIGGDEFAVLLSGQEIEKHYEEGLVHFEQEVKQYNDLPDKAFRISIASGFAVYDKDCDDTKLMDTYQRADKEMYRNKREIKAKQIPPDKYYAKG